MTKPIGFPKPAAKKKGHTSLKAVAARAEKKAATPKPERKVTTCTVNTCGHALSYHHGEKCDLCPCPAALSDAEPPAKAKPAKKEKKIPKALKKAFASGKADVSERGVVTIEEFLSTDERTISEGGPLRETMKLPVKMNEDEMLNATREIVEIHDRLETEEKAFAETKASHKERVDEMEKRHEELISVLRTGTRTEDVAVETIPNIKHRTMQTYRRDTRELVSARDMNPKEIEIHGNANLFDANESKATDGDVIDAEVPADDVVIEEGGDEPAE